MPAFSSKQARRFSGRKRAGRLVRGEHVPETGTRDDVARAGRIVRQLLTQAPEGHSQDLVLASVGVAPDLREQLVAAEDDARACYETAEQAVLRRREVHVASGEYHLLPSEVDLEVAEDERGRLPLGALRRARPPEHGLDARQ